MKTNRMGAMVIAGLMVGLLLAALPVLAQETPAAPDATPVPLTMEEAERVLYGLREATNNGDFDASAAFVADDVTWYYRMPDGTEEHLDDHDAVTSRLDYQLSFFNCEEVSWVTSVEADTATMTLVRMCTPTAYPFWIDFGTVEATIRDGKVVRYVESWHPQNDVYGHRLESMQEQVVAFAIAYNRGDAERLTELLAPEVTLGNSFDPLTGVALDQAGRDAVLATLLDWHDAGVRIKATPVYSRGNRLLVDGTMQWPAWKEVMGVPLYSDDAYTLTDGQLVAITLTPRTEMTKVFQARLR